MELTLAAQRFGSMSGNPQNGFAGRAFCFVRNRFRAAADDGQRARRLSEKGWRDDRRDWP
jgi:hypothetical protein